MGTVDPIRAIFRTIEELQSIICEITIVKSEQVLP